MFARPSKWWTLCGCLFVLGCGAGGAKPGGGPGTPAPISAAPAGNVTPDPYGSYYGVGEIKFLDTVQSNAQLDPGIASLSFLTPDGREMNLSEYVGNRQVVLVVTRGNTNPVCPYCTTQTARLIASYDQFQQRGTEIVVVYPVQAQADQARLEEFLKVTRSKLDDPHRPVPFPVVLDIELKAVDQLGIRKDLSKPATYVVDHEGNVRFAHVGEHWADRPSVRAVLDQLDALKSTAAPDAAAPAE
jgi:peroxiredoxin